jgi:DNA-binding transcriptional regulator YdaS (Cro superfamily)
MKLLAYLNSLGGREPQALFAEAVGSSIGHLRNCGYGYRPVDPALCVAIERHSAGEVTRAELRPDDYWLIWPDLPAPKKQKQAA